MKKIYCSFEDKNMKTSSLLLLFFILLTFSSCANTQTNTSNITNSNITKNDNEKECNTDKECDIKERRVYRLAPENYFQEDKNISNTDPICQIYVDALNSYPLIIDFFEAPIQPNTTIFSYPKWEQYDIYEYKDIYLRIIGSYVGLEDYAARKAELEKNWWMEDSRSERDKDLKRGIWQMYYARADIDNDNVTDDIIKIDANRYVTVNPELSSQLTIFNGLPEKSFQDIYRDLSEKLESNFIYNLFFYKGKTYIKEISYDVFYDEFYYMYILQFNDKKELIPLCVII
jgi:hypothetical protein